MTRFESAAELDTAANTEMLVVASLQELREMLDYKKLGVRVLQEISAALIAQGLGYFPASVLDDNPTPRQWDEVRVYSKSTPLGKLVNAVLEPSEKNDTFLIEASSAEDAKAAETLDQIRTLVSI